MSSCNNVNTTGGTSPGTSDIDFYLAVAKGDFTGYTKVNKFGYNDSIGSGAFEVIWETGGQYPYQSSAVTVDVVSDNANDDVAGTGARTLKIQGLDGSYNLAEETVDMDGTTTVTTTQTFLRVFRMSVETAGTSGNNEGDITVTYTGGSDVAATITAGNGQTLMAVYTIPAGKTGYIVAMNFGSSKDQEQTCKLKTRDNTVANSAFQTKEYLNIRGGFTYFPKRAITKITEKTDIELQAISNSTSSASGGFELILIDN